MMKKRITHSVKLTCQTLEVDGKRVAMAVEGEPFLTSLYHAASIEYPKFFKMDLLCKVGFIASEYLLNAEGKERFLPADDRAVLLFNRNSSWNADTTFQQTIDNLEEFYPSPAVFVYTLPNIVTGEIAIRNKYHGESDFILLPEMSEAAMSQAIDRAFLDPATTSVLAGWVEAVSEDDFEAFLTITEGC